MNATPQSKEHVSIHPGTQVGHLSLTVSDLDRSVDFYTGTLGFRLLERKDGNATLGAGDTPLLLFTEEPGAQPKPPRATGLYHFAILVPSRADLGRSLRRLAETGYPLAGASDHLVSEALYLSDPDENGIEIYRDRPRNEWPTLDNGQVRMAADPIDLRGLLAEAPDEPWAGLAPGTRIGHMHLQVGDIPQAEAFYVDTLGFDVVAVWHNALFVSAGGYHHHVGLNTWNSRNGPPQPVGSAGLRYFTFTLPDEAELSRIAARLQAANLPFERDAGSLSVTDAWGNRILFVLA
jgi:catechol 2,3-dioxygenase